MSRTCLVLLLTLAASSTCIAAETRSADTGRPRGVGPEFAKFYKDPTHFACISLPSITIPFSAINDDYCDCPDGSDEPGTSACSQLSHLSPHSPFNNPPPGEAQNISTPALPGFYCKNKGHTAAYLDFLAVNDGKCDYDFCCDGSDEWAHVGGTTCPDRCKDIGKEWRKKDEARKKALGSAVKRRKELAMEAARLRNEIKARVTTLEQEVRDSEAKVTQLEKEVVETEKKEKYKVVKSAGAGSRTTILAAMAKMRVEELRTSLVQTRAQRDAQRARVEELESILAVFKDEYNPNFNDEGVKRAVRSWEDYAVRDKEGDWESAQDRDLDEIMKEDTDEQGINWPEWEVEVDSGDTEDDVAALYNLHSYLPPSLRIFIAEKLSSLREFLVNNGILAPATVSDSSTVPESAALTSARNSLSSARTSFSTSKSSLTSSQSDLDKSYGPDDIFRSLKDTCVSVDSGEYVYTHCLLSRMSQKPKKGGGETNMGNFIEITSIPSSETDASLDPEDLTAGPANASPGAAAAVGTPHGPNERIVLEYKNGQGCWNGPARSTRVIMGCSEKEVIWRVRESEKCVYEVWAGSPAVCPESLAGNLKESKRTGKDEL